MARPFNLCRASDVNKLLYLVGQSLPRGPERDAIIFLSLHDVGTAIAETMKKHRTTAKAAKAGKAQT